MNRDLNWGLAPFMALLVLALLLALVYCEPASAGSIGRQIDTEHFGTEPELPASSGAGLDYGRGVRAFEAGGTVGRKIGEAIRVGRESRRREYRNRVEAGALLCDPLLPAISGGDEGALRACLSVLLD